MCCGELMCGDWMVMWGIGLRWRWEKGAFAGRLVVCVEKLGVLLVVNAHWVMLVLLERFGEFFLVWFSDRV